MIDNSFHCYLHNYLLTIKRLKLSDVHYVDVSVGRLRALPVACWTTDHYGPCSNLGVGISEGYFIFDFASLPLEVARPI